VLIIVLVIAIGLFALNQFFAWHYKAELLQKPCDLCMKLNPDLELTTKITRLNMTDNGTYIINYTIPHYV
jgi:hypothetical protein